MALARVIARCASLPYRPRRPAISIMAVEDSGVLTIARRRTHAQQELRRWERL